MPTLSDSSVHEDEDDIVAEYEKRDTYSDHSSVGKDDNEDSGNEESKDDKTTARRIDPSTSKRHIVKNPVPKLNSERLKGPKGIQTIEKYFEGFKFHGKNHEKTDLDRIMKRMEHWAHRLFPKVDFDDFLNRVEQLGTKKDLQVFVKKYRQDMITTDDDLINQDNIADEKEWEESEPTDEFDILIAEQIEKQKQVSIQHESSASDVTADKSSTTTENTFNQLLSNSTNKNSQPNIEETAPSQLSDEVKERIERNRQQAIQRRLTRLKEQEEETKRKKLDETGPHSLVDNGFKEMSKE